MEFNEKLQWLRKQKGLTQEELAEDLFVSRTAISKWESARGFPNIESLKEISRYFSVSLDDLLSADAILAIAERDHEDRAHMVRDLIFGLLDFGMALLLFIPVFGQNANGTVQNVSLLSVAMVRPYLKAAYFMVLFAMIAMGILMLALQNCRHCFWKQNKHIISVVLSVISVLLFIISRQPYAAAFSFAFLIMKGFMLIKLQ